MTELKRPDAHGIDEDGFVHYYDKKQMDSFLSSCAEQIRKAMELKREAAKHSKFFCSDNQLMQRVEAEYDELNAKADQMLEDVMKKLKDEQTAKKINHAGVLGRKF